MEYGRDPTLNKSTVKKQYRKIINKSSGFSLLELIIVLVIIGVMTASITLYFSDDRDDKLKQETQRLAAKINFAQEDAILTNQEFGLEIKQTEYRFLVLSDDGWIDLDSTEERQLKAHRLPENVQIEIAEDGVFALFNDYKNNNKYFSEQDQQLETDESGKIKEIVRPQIFLLSSGELNPFKIFMGYDDQSPVYYQISATYNGTVSVEGPFYDSLRLEFAKYKLESK